MKIHFAGRIILIFIVAFAVCALSGAALADVIWEPEDSFFAAHAGECEYVNTSYYSNAESGYMEVFNKPNGSGIGFADNGQLFYISHVYHDKSGDWGIIEYSEQENRLIPANYELDIEVGWIKLADTMEKYNSNSFFLDHDSEISDFSGDASALLEQPIIAQWTYPNSGELQEKMDGELIDDDFARCFSASYTDEAGQEWLYSSYYRGSRDFWVCLSDPSNTMLPAANAFEPAFHQPSSPEPPRASGSGFNILVFACVFIAVAISAVAVYLLGRKNKAAKED